MRIALAPLNLAYRLSYGLQTLSLEARGGGNSPLYEFAFKTTSYGGGGGGGGTGDGRLFELLEPALRWVTDHPLIAASISY